MNALTSQREALAPTNMTDMMKMSEMLAASSMVPAAYRGKPQDVMVALLWGAEVGLGAIQALTGIAIINGRPSIWGDAALALVRSHPACAGISEGTEGDGDETRGWCEVIRRGQKPERRTFSVAEAKRAGLWGKAGPWTQYPRRMLQMRARGFAIRDVFPDALRGVITAEEAQDYTPEPPREVPNLAQTVTDGGFPSAGSFTFAALDDQLAMLDSLDEIKGYLAQPAVVAFRQRAEKRGGDFAVRWAEVVQGHIARVSPESREYELPEPREPGEEG